MEFFALLDNINEEVNQEKSNKNPVINSHTERLHGWRSQQGFK